MKSWATKLIVGLSSLALTILVFANTYEIVYSRDIPVARSVTRYQTQQPINSLIADLALKQGVKQSRFSPLVKPRNLEIESANIRLQLEEARRIDGAWYTRPSSGSYLALNRDPSGAGIDFLIYTQQSWRSVPDRHQLDTGMDVTLFHDQNSQMHFVITAKETKPASQPIVIAKTEERQLILLVEDPAGHEYVGYTLTQGR